MWAPHHSFLVQNMNFITSHTISCSFTSPRPLDPPDVPVELYRLELLVRTSTDLARLLLIQALSFERYQAIARPFSVSKATARRRAIVVSLTVGGAVVLLGGLAINNTNKNSSNINRYKYNITNDSSNSNRYKYNITNNNNNSNRYKYNNTNNNSNSNRHNTTNNNSIIYKHNTTSNHNNSTSYECNTIKNNNSYKYNITSDNNNSITYRYNTVYNFKCSTTNNNNNNNINNNSITYKCITTNNNKYNNSNSFKYITSKKQQ
ncbi:hypothetical protein ElyMa_005976500 [Elysia marginata]|uniref:Uncharacterized protein n=1 Tax=Elysia marginata TaxID=1093978 RepID=A0AAV4GCR7_9GAST|nr:hypothetical protein ElyMa_005976500 [Elysia marginata]